MNRVFSLLLLGLISFAGFAQAAQGEYIIVSGGVASPSMEALRKPIDRHDKWWGNFVRPARVRIQKIQKIDPNADITWLVYRSSYTVRAREDGRPLISFIESVRNKYKVRLVWIQTGDDVIRYINSGRNRRTTPVVSFEYFGHSNKYCLLLDYGAEILGASTAWIQTRDLRKIRPRSFAPNALCKSWGCHTGEYMSRVWKRHCKIPLWGAIGKTDYSNGKVPFLSSPMGRWVQ